MQQQFSSASSSSSSATETASIRSDKTSSLSRRNQIVYNLAQLKHDKQLKQIKSMSDDFLLKQLPQTIQEMRIEVDDHVNNVNHLIQHLNQKHQETMSNLIGSKYELINFGTVRFETNSSMT
jgi:hypothetical protein